MRRRLEKKIPLPVWVENDASCFALAESLIGAGKNYSVVLGITLGTGLGGGLVINQKIFKGKGGASELGHTILDFHGPKCECGNAGCLEQFVGKKGLARLAKQHHFATKEGAALYRLAQDGNKKALRIWQVLGSFLGIGLVNAINVYDPEIIVLGGGISQAGKFFKKAMESEIKRRSFLKPGLIKVSQLKKGGVIGAALLAKRSFDKSPN